MVAWAGHGSVDDPRVSDADITGLIGHVDKLGIDVPLGRPTAFAEAVWHHSLDGTWPSGYLHSEMDAYRYRVTDLYVWKNAGMSPPLSVSTDRIAIPTMRAAAVLAREEPKVALDGSGTVIEVYPAAAVRRWGLPSRGYKGPQHADDRRRLVDLFADATSEWLVLSAADRDACEASDDVFDALVAAVVTRAACVDAVDPVPHQHWAAAMKEGWIALPGQGSLADLGSG